MALCTCTVVDCIPVLKRETDTHTYTCWEIFDGKELGNKRALKKLIMVMLFRLK